MSDQGFDDDNRQGRDQSVLPLVSRPDRQTPDIVSFNQKELREIFNLYGRKVADGEWRDYALDFSTQEAVFSIYRRASEYPLYRIFKHPRLARKQGAYSVVSAAGAVLKRGHELRTVLLILDKRLTLVSG